MINGFLLGACTFEQALGFLNESDEEHICTASAQVIPEGSASLCSSHGAARSEKVTARGGNNTHRTRNRSFDRRRREKGGETIRRMG